MIDSAETAALPSPAQAPAAVAQPGEPPAWRADLLAGITNGILSVPQGIAFALIAGVDPRYGLYAMIVPTIVGAIVRDSPFLIAGSTNTSALVIGAMIAALARPFAGQDPQATMVAIMLLITLLMGLLQVGFAALRLGKAGRFVSQAVLVGFTFGAAALIAAGQIKNVLGVELDARHVDLLGELRDLSGHLSGVDFRAVGIAALTLAIVYVCSRISNLLPGPLIAIALAGLLTAWMGWHDPQTGVRVLSAIPRELPEWSVPPVTDGALLREALLPALAISILGMVEAISIGKALASRARIPFHANRELAAQGLGNIAGAFFSCMPASASWTRSAVNMELKARTRWAGIYAGITVLAIMMLLAPWARFIPYASLGALVIWIATRMVDPQAAKYVMRWSRADAAVLFVTFAAILVLEIQYAIYLGVFASLLMLVRRAGRLHVVQMVETAPGQYRELEIDEQTGAHPVVLLQLEGDLFFGVVEEMEERLANIAKNGARAVILRMKRAHAIDATASESLAAFAAHFKASGGRLILCGLKDDLFEQIQSSHLGQVLGEENLLRTGPKAFASVQMAIQAAIGHVKQCGSVAPTQTLIRKASGEVTDAWSYQI